MEKATFERFKNTSSNFFPADSNTFIASLENEAISGGAVTERRSCAEKSCRVVTQSFDEYFGSLADVRWLKFVQNGIGASFRSLIVVRDPRVLLLQKYKDQKNDIMEYADEIVKYCDSMVDNWSRLYDLTQESFSKSIKIIKYEDLQMNYQNEIKDALLFLKLDSAKFDPFPIFEDSLSLTLRRNIYKAFNAVQNDCGKFMKMFHYNQLLFEDFLNSLEYLSITVTHD
ncbi:Oidioi.mRNA.OKI2018_I69.chr1.g941.t1.cds [Oikopleura dioica]|uniref:Oidioi.mRNA.OKI2018_I69.chr1.g941.t1.cds n=1 Tax=Oikopleura dioica TaxID=34765 RepID=A0ABN7SN62_OIKDI|nr:Oidioi.mRNA.OKI2018_I69.chr1.g941.t1.cds [Oikopleura dioica]